MMEAVFPRSWKEDFERAASNEREDILYREKMKRFEAREYERRAELHLEEVRQEERAFAAFEAAMATPEAVTEYRHEIRHLNVTTVEALMDNEEAFGKESKERDMVLAEAYVLPDGRRAFKTADGRKVFDEHGEELSPNVVAPDMIDDKKPRWERLKGINDKLDSLRAERRELLEYQERLDDADARLDKGGITNGELKRMKTDLDDSMPDAVREKLGIEKPKAEAEQNLSQNAPSSLPNNMDALVRQTGMGPSGP